MDFTLKDFLKIVEEEHQKAIEKHPVFCHQLCDIPLASYERMAKTQRDNNDEDEQKNKVFGDCVVMEEIYEMFVEAQTNHIDDMIVEAAQACQTIFRAVQFKIAELEKNKKCKACTN